MLYILQSAITVVLRICLLEQFMEFKLMLMLLSVTLSILLLINGASLTSCHQDQASHGLAEENWFGHAAMPRKLLLNQKVEGIKHKDLVYNQALSDESHNGGEDATTAASQPTMHEGSHLTPLFTMDYSRVRKRRPVHNKSFPATTTFP